MSRALLRVRPPCPARVPHLVDRPLPATTWAPGRRGRPGPV